MKAEEIHLLDQAWAKNKERAGHFVEARRQVQAGEPLHAESRAAVVIACTLVLYQLKLNNALARLPEPAPGQLAQEVADVLDKNYPMLALFKDDFFRIASGGLKSRGDEMTYRAAASAVCGELIRRGYAHPSPDYRHKEVLQ